MAEGKAGPVFFRDAILEKLPRLQGRPHVHLAEVRRFSGLKRKSS